MHPSRVAAGLDVFEHVLLRLLPRLAALAVHRLAHERLEGGFRGRVVPWVARPRHGLGDPMGLEAALERPGSVLGTLAVVEDEAEALGRALPSDRLLEHIHGRLLGDAPGHRPAHDLAGEGACHGREIGPSFARFDVADPPLLRRPEVDRRDRQLQQARLVEVQGGPRVVRPHSEPGAQRQGGPGLPVLLGTQGARRLQRPGHHASRHSGDVAPAHEQALEAHRRAGHKPQARMVARRVRPRLSDGRQRQGEVQAGLLPVLFGEEEAREADKARLALGPSARKERGRRVGASCL